MVVTKLLLLVCCFNPSPSLCMFQVARWKDNLQRRNLQSTKRIVGVKYVLGSKNKKNENAVMLFVVQFVYNDEMVGFVFFHIIHRLLFPQLTYIA